MEGMAVADLTSSFQAAVTSLLFLVSIDLVSLVVTFLALHRYCQVNMFKVYVYLQKEYGYAFAMQQAYLLDYLFCTIAINCAFDFTLHFDWIFDPSYANVTEHNNTVHDAVEVGNFTSMNVIWRFILYLTHD